MQANQFLINVDLIAALNRGGTLSLSNFFLDILFNA
jgi:hypothetical protein